MERPIRRVSVGLLAGLVLLISSCGGGGGGSSPNPSPQPGAPTATLTPIPQGPSRNEKSTSNAAGTLTLRVESLSLLIGETTTFSVFTTNSQGRPIAGEQIAIESGLELLTLDPATGVTRSDGSVSGTLLAVSGGQFPLTASVVGDSSRLNGLSVVLTTVVTAPIAPTPLPTATATITPPPPNTATPSPSPLPSVTFTASPTFTPSPTLSPTATNTPLPCDDVQTIIVQTDLLNVSSQSGGHATITAVVFDSDNVPVSRVNVLFDVQPRIATFRELVKATDNSGVVSTVLTIPPDAAPGQLVITGSACSKTGTVAIQVVSGSSEKPVQNVVLQADPGTIGNQVGGQVNLSATVFDSDNNPINGIDALFITPVGHVNPLTDTTRVFGSQAGTATAILQIPPGSVAGPYIVTALAGGISGTTTINIVPGRGENGDKLPGVPPGLPAAIRLSASNARLQVAGTGGTELASISALVRDNNGQPLSGVRVGFRVIAAQSAPGAVILPGTQPPGTPPPTPANPLCSPSDPFALTDAAGVAIIQLRSGDQPGPVTIAACVETTANGVPQPLTSQQSLVSITAGPVNRIILSINSVFVDNNDGTLLTTLSAIVNDSQRNAVEDGTPVSFEIVGRKICSGGSSDGQSCSSSSTCNGGSCIDDLTDPSNSVSITSSSVTNGVPPCDVSQFPVQTGLIITLQPGTAVTCIKFPLTSQGTEVVVRARTAGVTNNLAGEALQLPGLLDPPLVGVNPPSINVSATNEGVALVKATVLDSRGDGVENVRVRFSTTIGAIDRSDLTDANGDATATLTIPAGSQSGNARVRVFIRPQDPVDVQVPIVASAGMTPTPGTSSQPAALQFLGSSRAIIGVRGSGLPEQSLLTFQVTDGFGDPVSGAIVTFSIANISGESISPLQVASDAEGKARVTVTSGQTALSVQVTAQISSVIPPLVTRSTAVTVVGGRPSQDHFSLAHEFNNISGRVTFGLTNDVQAFVADRFGNPVQPGTTVTFTTDGGAVGASTVTDSLGQAKATLVSQAPLPANGTVSTLVTTLGERPFVDANDNGVCDPGEQLIPVSEPYYDSNCNGIYDAGEQFTDLNDDGQFNVDQGAAPRTCTDQIFVFDSICSTFSAGTIPTLRVVGVPNQGEALVIPAGGSRTFELTVTDSGDPTAGNPIVGGSRITVTYGGARGKVLGLTDLTMPDAFTNNVIVDGINRFRFTVVDNDPTGHAETDAVKVDIKSDVQSLPAGGNGSVTISQAITFLAAPTPTPTPTFTASPTPTASVTPTPSPTDTLTSTPTPTLTPTPTPLPPSLSPNQAVLPLGSGAQPNTCNGGTQTFVVTNGTAPLSVFAGGGCVSVTTLPVAGGSFTYTAGNVTGSYSITVTDAVGRTTTAGVQIIGAATSTPTFTPQPGPPTNTAPPTNTVKPTPGAAFVRLDQILDHVTDNLDGTYTTIVSALVTDKNGAVVGDGVPVEFSLADPVPGASVTSIGFTREAQPCTIDFSVVLQPGDALSCLKYVAGLQGTRVRVRARVATEPGAPNEFIEDVREIVLIDTRPTQTPTQTETPTVQPTPTATIEPPRIVPSNTSAFAGVQGAPGCNGIARSFVVTGGAPPFLLSAGGNGCLSTAVVEQSGGTFSFTTGNQVGSFVITATDRLGRISTAGVTQQGAPAAFVDVDLFEDRRLDNGDGSFTSIATALVTDSIGRTVPDGVPIEFSLVDPISGVSITSPGLTNGRPPCDSGALQITAQPGDSLACIKYTSNRQGSTITIRARVTAASGEVLEAVRSVKLPDTRPTPTPTQTRTFTPTETATISPTATAFPSGVATFTAAATATASPTPPLGSVEFIGADPAVIGVRASGRPEQSVLTFRLKNTLNVPLPGLPVTFTIVGTGTETLNPTSAITDVDGLVRTTVTSGTRATAVRITAGADATGDLIPDIFASSTSLSILGAPPAQRRFSVAPDRRNVAGRVKAGSTVGISAFVNDRFGNAVPTGTAVSFVTNAASVVNPSTTDVNGVAKATLLAEQLLPPTGIVSILGFTLGEEAFLDNNGNGAYNAGEPIITDNSLEPFIDFRPYPPSDAACTVAPPSPLCNNMFDPSTPFELFVDRPPANGIWDTQGRSGQWDNDIFVYDATHVTFSGPLALPRASSPNATGTDSGGRPFIQFVAGGNAEIFVEVHDDLFNPLVGGAQVSLRVQPDTLFTVSGSPVTVPDAHSFNQLIDGVTRFAFLISDLTPSAGQTFAVSVSINSENGSGDFVVASGKVFDQVPSPTPQPTAVPPPFSISFFRAEPAVIGVQGAGLPEQSVVTFSVVDSTLTRPVAGTLVTFSLTGPGDETLSATQSLTDSQGFARTTVISGQRAARVRVTAGIDRDHDGTPDLFVQSDEINIFGAAPSANRFSLATQRLNVPGRVTFGVTTEIDAFVNDRFGNAVPPGTVVTFSTNGASIVAPRTTDQNGVARGTLVTEGQVPPSGIVTVLGYARGEEGFLDNNGNGVFDVGIDTVNSDNLREPFIDFRPLPPLDAGCPIPVGSSLCNDMFNPATPFELFIDTNSNGMWDTQGTSGVWDNNVLVFDSLPITFSGPLVVPEVSPTQFTIPNGGSRTFTVAVHDDLGNPIVGGSSISMTSSTSDVSITPSTITVPDGESFNQPVPGLTVFTFTVSDVFSGPTSGPVSLTLRVTSQNGNFTDIVAVGTVQ